jgi:cellulose synthase operon protein C
MRFERSVVLLAGALILSSCSETPLAKESRYLDKGAKEFAKKNYSVAALHFKNAMAAQPRDAEPYYRLALVNLASNDINTAASYLRKACELNPKHTGAQLKLAELLAASANKGLIEEAQKRARDVLALLPEDPNALYILAVTELRLGNRQSSEEFLLRALRKAPSHLKSSVLLAQARLARKDVAGAEEVLKQSAAQAPKSPDPKVYLGEFYLAQNKTAEAEQQFRQAIAFNPKYAPSLLALASLQVRSGQTAQAEQTFRQIAALPEKQYRSVHAQYLFQSGKQAEAVAELEKLFAADPEDRNLRTELVRAYLALNRVADAEKVLTAALKRNGLDTNALLQRARIYLGSKKYNEAQTDLNVVLHYQGESAEAHYLLAQARKGLGDTAIQKQELGQVLRIAPKFLAARIELAQALLTGGGAQASLNLLEEAPAEQKDAVAVRVQRNWALLALNRKAEARKEIDRILSGSQVPEAQLQDAALKLDQKDYTGARAAAEKVLAQSPDDVRALSLLVRSYIAQNQTPVGLTKVREYAQQRPASSPVQEFLGRLLLAVGDRPGARKAFEAAKGASPGLLSAELLLAQMDNMEGKRNEARKRLQGALASQPGNITGRLLLAEVELGDGKPAQAIEQYRKALEIDSKNAYALNGLAYLLADSKRPDEALKYAQQAKELDPGNAAVDDTLGWTYYQKGMYSMAVTHMESAAARAGTAVHKYHLAMAYLKAGDPARGRQNLEAALKMNPNLPEAQMARQIFANTQR